MARKAHRPPSQARYDAGHPTVSVRVSPEVKAALDEIRELTDKSIGDILRGAVGVQRQSAGAAYDRGHRDGWNAARNRFAVAYACAVCGKLIVVESDDEKKAIARYMRESGWCHGECAERAVRRS